MDFDFDGHGRGFDQARLFCKGFVQGRSETRQVHANVKTRKNSKKGDYKNQSISSRVCSSSLAHLQLIDGRAVDVQRREVTSTEKILTPQIFYFGRLSLHCFAIGESRYVGRHGGGRVGGEG